MPPVKQRNMPEERKENFIALKQEVKVSDLIEALLTFVPAGQKDKLGSLLEKYNKGTLRGRALASSHSPSPPLPRVRDRPFCIPFSCAAAAYTLVKNVVGLAACKGAFEHLVPGYNHEHSVRTVALPRVREARTAWLAHWPPLTATLGAPPCRPSRTSTPSSSKLHSACRRHQAIMCRASVGSRPV